MFRAYAERYGRRSGFDEPALLPQVWVHYDPKSRAQRGETPLLTTQRMDFLLLLAGDRHVVLEVDGKSHYTDAAGAPSPRKYAEMVADERELTLRGYEVFRFGGAELPDQQSASSLLNPFFNRLIDGSER